MRGSLGKQASFLQHEHRAQRKLVAEASVFVTARHGAGGLIAMFRDGVARRGSGSDA